MTLRDKIAHAIAKAEAVGHSIQLVSLIDGEATYTLTFGDSLETLEFPSSADACEHLNKVRLEAKVDAVLAAAREPTWPMIEAGQIQLHPWPRQPKLYGIEASATWHAMIDAASRDRDAAPRGREAAEAEGQQPGPEGDRQPPVTQKG